MNETFRDSTAACPVTYETNADYSRLTAAYPLLKIAGDGTDYSKMKNLLSWEASHISHKGDYDGHVKIPPSISPCQTYIDKIPKK